MSRQNELILRVIERFLYHKNYETDNPICADMAKNMSELELFEMWMLTQK